MYLCRGKRHAVVVWKLRVFMFSAIMLNVFLEVSLERLVPQGVTDILSGAIFPLDQVLNVHETFGDVNFFVERIDLGTTYISKLHPLRGWGFWDPWLTENLFTSLCSHFLFAPLHPCVYSLRERSRVLLSKEGSNKVNYEGSGYSWKMCASYPVRITWKPTNCEGAQQLVKSRRSPTSCKSSTSCKDLSRVTS